VAEGLIVYCGLDCARCDAYRATGAGDTARLEALALEWYGTADAALTRCVGCATGNGSPRSKWCGECPVRACARMMAIPNCAYCSDYDVCATLAEMFEHSAEAKLRLDALCAAR
jgi:hypothetical protein